MKSSSCSRTTAHKVLSLELSRKNVSRITQPLTGLLNESIIYATNVCYDFLQLVPLFIEPFIISELSLNHALIQGARFVS